MISVVQPDIGGLLEMAGAHPRGNRHDCPKCGGQRAVTHNQEVFFCHRCKWSGNVTTLEKQLGIHHRLPSAEHRELRRTRDQERQKAEAEIRERQEAACRLAQSILSGSQPANDFHAYLVRKRVGAHGIFCRAGELVIPIRDAEGILWNIQRITSSGEKLFLTGGRVIGCFYMIGNAAKRLFFCEGYATGASVHEATGDAVALAFFAGNLIHVAAALVTKYPNVQLVIAADNDANKPGNPGKSKAIEAARRCGMRAIWPTFPKGSTDTDFNDLGADIGLDALQSAIKSALQGK